MTEEILEILLDHANALEAAAVNIKQQIARITGIKEWDPSKIKWENAEGAKGPYQHSKDVNNPEHKAMIGDLAAHGGRMTREGYFFWVFEDGSTVGRKERGTANAKAAEAQVNASEFFPENLRTMLTFEEQADAVIIKPKQYLGKENFAKIAGIVKEAGGEYISQGRQSHFRISRKAGT